MEYLVFYSAIPFSIEEKRLIADKMDYTYHILDFEFPKEHSHKDYWEFLIILDGKVNHYLNGKKEVYQKNTLFYLTTKDFHSLRSNDKNLRYLNIMAKEEPLLRLLNAMPSAFVDFLLNEKRPYQLPDHIIFEVEAILHKANLLSAKEYETHSKLIFSALMLILQFLYTQQIKSVEKSESWEETLNELMQTKEFLSYKIPDLCKKLGYSKSQLYRVFQKRFGISPHEYLINCKFNYARSLLSHSKMKIIDIATQVGFKNLSQFNIIFKQKLGITPGEYRKINRTD